MHLNYHSSEAAPMFFPLFPLFCVFSSSLIPFTPHLFVGFSLHLCDQTANLWGCNFLLICRAPLLPISTSERLLLMVPKKWNQPWIRTRPPPAFCRCAGHWECRILLSPNVSDKVQYNIYEMEIQTVYLAFVSQELSKSLNAHNDFIY